LQQKKEKEEALKELSQKYKDPSSIKYDLYNDNGDKVGFAEYTPQNDNLFISSGAPSSIQGNVLKSLRDILNKLLDE